MKLPHPNDHRDYHRKGADMRCLLCRNLEQAFEATRREFIESSSLACYSVSKKFAAYLNVEMERALNELQDHRSVCRSAMSESARLPVVARLGLNQQEALRIGSIETAA
jgi:hypothetical protein